MTKNIDGQGRPEPPLSGTEAETLIGYLDYLRATFLWKLQGLPQDQLRSRPLKSSMSLIGMAKHLAFVEDYWFSYVAQGNQPSEPWVSVDWGADKDWDWHSARKEPTNDVIALWEKSVSESRTHWDEVSSTDGFDLRNLAPRKVGINYVSFRWILTHMIEEYGRHCGHADLLREELDGATGE